MSSQHDVVQQDAHAAAHGDDDSMFWLPWLHDRTVQPVHGCTTALCSWPTAMRSWYNQSSLLCICMHASAGQANNVTALALESDGLQPTLVENKPCIQHPVLAGPHGTGPGPPRMAQEVHCSQALHSGSMCMLRLPHNTMGSFIYMLLMANYSFRLQTLPSL